MKVGFQLLGRVILMKKERNKNNVMYQNDISIYLQPAEVKI